MQEQWSAWTAEARNVAWTEGSTCQQPDYEILDTVIKSKCKCWAVRGVYGGGQDNSQMDKLNQCLCLILQGACDIGFESEDDTDEVIAAYSMTSQSDVDRV